MAAPAPAPTLTLCSTICCCKKSVYPFYTLIFWCLIYLKVIFLLTFGNKDYIASNNLSKIKIAGLKKSVSSTFSQSVPDNAILHFFSIIIDGKKSLSEFIKDQWSKKQSVCELEVFSNPLISVGDIVTINYPSNGLNGTEKFMVSSINNSFDGGLSTKITARSIYSL